MVPLRPGVGGSITVRGFRQPHQFQLRFLEAGTPPCDTPLLSPHLLGHCSKDSLPSCSQLPRGDGPSCTSGEPWEGFVPPMYRDKVFLFVYQLGTPASQQHLPSLCSCSPQRKAGCGQESVPKGGGRGVCDATSPSPHPSPQHSHSEMDFKACVRAGMSKPML